MGVLGNVLKAVTKAGWVNGHDFPFGSYINFAHDGAEKCFLITLPNKTEEKITHDMVRCASLMGMGVIEIKENGQGTQLIHGAKYLVVLKDGRSMVITVGLGNSMNRVEGVLF